MQDRPLLIREGGFALTIENQEITNQPLQAGASYLICLFCATVLFDVVGLCEFAAFGGNRNKKA